jgi:hypothetical protein
MVQYLQVHEITYLLPFINDQYRLLLALSESIFISFSTYRINRYQQILTAVRKYEIDVLDYIVAYPGFLDQ